VLISLKYIKNIQWYSDMAPQGSQHTPATVLLPQHRF